MTDTTNLAPQRFAGLPQFNTPLVDPKSGVVSQAWQWFFTAMWQKNGSTFSVVPTAAFPKQQPGLPITMHDAQSGDEIGQLITGTSIVMPPAEFTVVETVDADGNPNFAITWNNQSANEVFAGPASGAAAVPTFRFLVPGDLPIATVAAVGAVKPDGTSITIDPDGTIHGSAGGTIPLTSSHIFVGNVSNIATDVPMSGDATIATSGALTLANTAVTPASYGDATHIPSFTVDSKGRLTAASNNAIVIPSGDVVGPASSTDGDFALFNGTTGKLLKGTGITAARGDILYRGPSAWVALAPGTNGQVLITQGAGADPHWGSAGGGFVSAVQVNTYNVAGANTWNKPTNATRVKVILWGAGGGGGGGDGAATSPAANGGGGGGGGTQVQQEFNASDLGSSETVTIGTGGAGGTGGISPASGFTNGTKGSTGGNTTFGAHLTGFGGGGGGRGSQSGGTGAGSGQAGNLGAASGLRGGGPGSLTNNTEGVGGAGAGTGNTNNTGNAAEWGGGAGGIGITNSNGAAGGGSSMWGGAGGGGGGTINSSGATNTASAGDGGGTNIYELSSATSKSGGAHGTPGNPGTDGAAGVEAFGGQGGGGGGATVTSGGTGGKGGAGGQRGGGAGGGGAAGNATGINTGGAGGKGGDGYAIVVTYF